MRIACVTSTAGDHAAITPCSVANRKRAGPVSAPCVTTNAFEPLNTMPVGLPPVVIVGEGMDTTSDCTTPLPSYNVDTIPSAEETHTNPNGLNATPHPFTRLGSTCAAGMVPSDTRLRTL